MFFRILEKIMSLFPFRGKRWLNKRELQERLRRQTAAEGYSDWWVRPWARKEKK